MGDVTTILYPGPPAHSHWAFGDVAIDSNGVPWFCTWAGKADVGGTAQFVSEAVPAMGVSSGATASLTPSGADLSLLTSATGTFTFNNPTGTFVEGQKMTLRFKSSAGAMTYAFGTQFRACSGLALPTNSSNNKWDYVGFRYNAIDTKWDLLAVLQGF